MTGAALVFGKDPVPGRVKTRLTPALSSEQAAALYACMLEDVLATTAQVARALGLAPFLAIHPAEAVASWARRVPDGMEVIAQRGADLSERMEQAFESLRAQGFREIVLRGSDSPGLTRDALRQAYAALDGHELVLGPDRDGGYNLVASTRALPGLFDHPMSTGSVLDDTIANARALGLDAHLLEPSYDIDEPEDLLRLRRDRERGGLDTLCPKTLEYLDRFQLWPSGAE